MYYNIYLTRNDVDINIEEYLIVSESIFKKYSYQYIVNWLNTLINSNTVNFSNIEPLIDSDDKKTNQIIGIKVFLAIILYSFQTKNDNLVELLDLLTNTKSYSTFNNSIYYRHKNSNICNKFNNFISFYKYLDSKNDSKNDNFKYNYIKNYFESMVKNLN